LHSSHISKWVSVDFHVQFPENELQSIEEELLEKKRIDLERYAAAAAAAWGLLNHLPVSVGFLHQESPVCSS
jgi:hypothetical protein